MVKPLNSKPNILQRRREDLTRMMTHGKARVLPQDKGEYMGSCNRSACLKPKADWYNWGSQKYYCASCAHWLNCDEVNARDAQQMYGHTLCTMGTRDQYLENTVDNVIPSFILQNNARHEDYARIANPSREIRSFSGWMFKNFQYTVVGDIGEGKIGSTVDTYMYVRQLEKHPKVLELYNEYVQYMKSRFPEHAQGTENLDNDEDSSKPHA